MCIIICRIYYTNYDIYINKSLKPGIIFKMCSRSNLHSAGSLFYFSQKDMMCLMLIIPKQPIKRKCKELTFHEKGSYRNGFQQIPQLAQDLSR